MTELNTLYLVALVDAIDEDELVGTRVDAARALADALSTTRRQSAVDHRARAWELLRADGLTLPALAAMSGYHHSTILHHLNRLASEANAW